ncbi:PP0621 family protein [Hydrogenophaga sp.]|uniref:PP0621 family protein n=1 Tax=Hydrogenophaga sp. TaxID=1904254 RepID=UPI003D136419
MKYLLVLAVVIVAFYVWRNNRLGDQSEAARKAPPQPGRPKVPTVMVACRQCGTHLPENEAVQGRQGVYCSAEHRRLLED